MILVRIVTILCGIFMILVGITLTRLPFGMALMIDPNLTEFEYLAMIWRDGGKDHLAFFLFGAVGLCVSLYGGWIMTSSGSS